MTSHIRFLDEIGAEDLPLVGGKGANQGERTRPGAGWPRSSAGLLCLLDEGEDAMADVDTAPGCDLQVALDDARHSSTGQDAGKQGLWLRP